MAAKSLTEKQIMSSVKNGDIKPVYLFYGEENYTLDVLSDFFENDVIKSENQCFDQTVVYGRDVKMTAVIDIAKQYPTMPTSTHRLILVKEAQDIDKNEWELLLPYLEHPSSTSIVVFCYRNEKFKNAKLQKAIAAKGVVFEKKKLYEDKVSEWVIKYVAEQGYSISQQCAAIIAESLGTDTRKIANELSKVFISLPKGVAVTNDIIEREIGISKDYNVFELLNALGRKDVLKCNRIVNHFAANPKDNPIQLILPNIYGFFIKVMIYQQLTDKSQAPSALGVNPFFIRDYQTAARNYSLPKMAAIIGYLKEADLKSKGVRNTGTITDGEIIKELVFKILH
ncbi:MAG: DNA polymerase III subunit delta [Bacteroidales bacterium]|nr:DNA polymerase III subunit delta [Bacteroidales bacterium]MBR5029447.1 DNA polymerase III subunit delta [Bacteroidales bacterium]